MTFTPDSRWLAVSTKRGTTHLFAINPYGGKMNSFLHRKPKPFFFSQVLLMYALTQQLMLSIKPVDIIVVLVLMNNQFVNQRMPLMIMEQKILHQLIQQIHHQM
jgi:hypothetical protein